MSDYAAWPELAALAAQLDSVKLQTKAEAQAEAATKHRARQARYKAKQDAEKLSHIAVLDMETDPFDSLGQERIHPFAACLSSDHFDDIEIWEEDNARFIEKVVSAIENLPGKFTIYAHNGGKFDYLFLIHRLRGAVSFKGRGIMAANLGRHQLRDSFHILPEKLAAYRKDTFDYEKMRKGKRRKHKREIQEYLRNDCHYLLDFVKAFIAENGLKLSIGQASIASVKDAGITVDSINEHMDNYLRQFYFGGRVECLSGLGEFEGDYRLYDVNSMYPDVMSKLRHPTGSEYIIRRGSPGPHTIFIDLNCVNHGAFVARDENGGTTAGITEGRFRTTIWEYEVARKHGLMERPKINYVVDCLKRQDFSGFVIPAYNKRQDWKKIIKQLERDGLANTSDHLHAKISDILLKFYLNNAYGKYGQNPRNYKESLITDYGVRPTVCTTSDELEASVAEWSVRPVFENEEMNYAIWEKPVERLRFKNVGTSASIAGAARAALLDGLMHSTDPIYCDTDSIICKSLDGLPMHPVELGAWDTEDYFTRVRIAGKKLYACERTPEYAEKKGKQYKIASKGIKPPTWNEFGALIEGAVLQLVNPAPTFTRRQTQDYVTRSIRATATQPNGRLQRKLRDAG